MYTVTLKDNGKYISQARHTNSDGTTVVDYESPEYITKDMATADANCWIAFHSEKENTVNEETEYTIDADDTVKRFGNRNNRQVTTWTGEEFATWFTNHIAHLGATYYIADTWKDYKHEGGFFLVMQITDEYRTRESCFVVTKAA